MSLKKDSAPQEPRPDAHAQTDDTVLTLEALQRSQNHLEVRADGVTLWTPEGEHYALGTLQCDYADMDYRTAFSLIGGFCARGPRIVEA